MSYDLEDTITENVRHVMSFNLEDIIAENFRHLTSHDLEDTITKERKCNNILNEYNLKERCIFLHFLAEKRNGTV